MTLETIELHDPLTDVTVDTDDPRTVIEVSPTEYLVVEPA